MLKHKYFALGLLVAACFVSCQPDEEESNGIVNETVDASFTVTQIDANHFKLEATAVNGVSNYWDYGTGAISGGDSKTIFLPDAGTYTVTHTICGIGGECISTTETIVVDTPDPVAGNLILGGKFENAEDIAQWTVLPMSSDAHWAFANGTATLTSGPTGWAQEALYQEIQVEAGHEYKFDMKVSGPGWTDSVFELYADYQQPVPNSGDYSAGGKVLSLNTWAGCGNSSFDGQLFNLSCDSQWYGVKTFATSGTVYVLVRGGGANGNFNITIDNVEVRRND